jgi:hypothetical protein
MRAASIPFGLAYAADTADPADAAPRFRSLARAEQLTLWSLRAIALGHAECPALRRALHVALGSSAEEAFTSLFVAVRTLGWCARRRLRLHVPGCDGVSDDERRLLALFAAAQHALADGDEGEVRRQLDALVEPPLTEGFLMTLQTVASALEVNGYTLPTHEEPVGPDRRRLH